MKIYAIADLHLSFDERIDKPMDVFGPGWETMKRVKLLGPSWLQTMIL